MAVNITIPYPVITAPAYFRVRYRAAYPTSAPWTDLPDADNTPFSFSTPSDGSWVLGIVYVDEEGRECEEVLWPFDTIELCGCIEITEPEVVHELYGGPAHISIPYTNPLSVDPPCGVMIKYFEDGYPPATALVSIVYLNPMPASPINIPVPGLVPYHIEVILDCCDGNQQVCFNGVAPVEVPPLEVCVAVTGFNLVVDLVQSASTGLYYLRFTFPGLPTAAIPTLCEGMNVAANQLGVLYSEGGLGIHNPPDSIKAMLPASGFHTVAPAGKQILRRVNPASNIDWAGIRYDVVVHDCCGLAVSFGAIYFTGTQIP